MESVVEICKEVLKTLSKMDYERKGGSSMERLIFPIKIQANGTKERDRISEQELRQLFIEEFKVKHKDLYYSIETPTKNKYSFSNEKNEKKVGDIDNKGQSALVDMCVFDKEKKSYKRTFNIEFKHKNATHDNISKDILKLMHEEENGAFVLLLKNTNTGTLNNSAEKRFGVIDKLIESINYHHNKQVLWSGDETKFIELIILSLEEKKNGKPFIMNRTIFQRDLAALDKSLNKWKKEVLDGGKYKSVDLIEN